MYNLKYFFQKTPSQIASAVRVIFAALVLFHVFAMDEQQAMGIVIALEVVLGLFTVSQTVSVGTLHEADTTKTAVVATAAQNTNPEEPNVSLRAVAAVPVVNDPPSRYSGQSGRIPMVLLACALAASSVACGARSGQAVTQPHVVAAQYGTDIMHVTIGLQDIVIAYTKANGGNATTDAIMAGIRNHVIPTAERLSATLKAYDAITDPQLKALRIEEIDRTLASLLTAYGEVTKNNEIATLASEATLASARIRELVLAVKLAIRNGVVSAPAATVSQDVTPKFKAIHVQ